MGDRRLQALPGNVDPVSTKRDPPPVSPAEKVPIGPEPTLLSRKEVDALYEMLDKVIEALSSLGVDYIVTGGSLLGAVRQHSILFCDDDIDIAIVEHGNGPTCPNYDKVRDKLQATLGSDFSYKVRPWEGGDKVFLKRMPSVFVDVFTIRKYETLSELVEVIGVKTNGQNQTDEYVEGILDKIETVAFSQNEKSPLFPCYHFNTRKAIELWPKEVYRRSEMFPLTSNLNFGPLTGVKGPRTPVRLLKRAFGLDCFEVFYQSGSHKKKQANPILPKGVPLKPVVMNGGTWEGGRKVPLRDEHFLPMQPVEKKKRKPTQHSRNRLLSYLAEQTEREKEVRPANKTVYMDGVFDLFHRGHLRAIQMAWSLGSRLVIGVTGDKDASFYKRPPVVSENDRVALVSALSEVDLVVCPCPLVVTEEFMKEHGIDLVVHGFADDCDAMRQEEFFRIPMKCGKFARIDYYRKLSTTDIIRRIKSGKDQRFGESITKFFSSQSNQTDGVTIPYALRQIIEPHINWARKRRVEILNAIRLATGADTFDFVMREFKKDFCEGDMTFHDGRRLQSTFLSCCKLPLAYDLARIGAEKKKAMLYEFVQDFSWFQEVYDEFVRDVCCPKFDAMFGCDTIYYQAFPCVRCILPGEFSIGPHCDMMYGHHPCTVNFYVPLTKIDGTASVYLESETGREDWHPIVGEYGIIKYFAGGICNHWTTENQTDYTRVSLDFRMIPGHFFHILQDSGGFEGGQRDVYRKQHGYYVCCEKVGGKWRRKDEEGGVKPDHRCGFPWTVKNWSDLG